MKVLACFFFTIFFSISCFSQVLTPKQKKFTGIVFTKDSLKNTSGVSIQINNKKMVISKENGHFSFYADPKDTIQIFKDGFKNIGLIIPDSINAEENLIGIFMAKDFVDAKNVLILPKVDDAYMKNMMLSSKSDNQLQNAKHNLKLVTYQAMTGKDNEWDASQNQKNTLRQYESNVEYKCMIPPDKMLMFTKIIPYKNKIEKDDVRAKNIPEITPKEENILKQIYIDQNRKQ